MCPSFTASNEKKIKTTNVASFNEFFLSLWANIFMSIPFSLWQIQLKFQMLNVGIFSNLVCFRKEYNGVGEEREPIHISVYVTDSLETIHILYELQMLIL